MRTRHRIVVGLVAAVLALTSVFTAGAAQAAPAEPAVSAAATSFSNLALINGWSNYGGGTRPAAIAVIGGVVHLKGAISTGGTNPEPFTLDKTGYRPAADVYVPVDLCNGKNGRLQIKPSGDVYVQAETSFSDAACFTSLEGVTWPVTTTSFVNLKLINGWSNGLYGTRAAAIKNIAGVAVFKGAISGGTTSAPFVLPAAYRPAADVYVAVDLCNATNGRLWIQKNGVVTVQAENSVFANAQCFTSLEGVSYTLTTTGITNLKLINGWTNAPYSTRKAAVKSVSGVVQFKGAIATPGTVNAPFILPAAFRPSGIVYVKVDLCNAANGRMVIDSSGEVLIYAEDAFSSAQCFTSLEGVSYPLG